MLIWEGTLDGKYVSVRYSNRLTKNRGLCHRQKDGSFKITIRPDMPPKETLEVLIHEMLHALLWAVDEEYIQEGGVKIRDAVVAWIKDNDITSEDV